MKKILILVIALLALVACGNNQSDETNETSTDEDEVPKMIEVKIQTVPEEILPNEKVTIQALVTQGDETVDDADDVQFEIWMEGQEEHVKVPSENQGNGVYSIEKEFKDAGTYYVIAHVTARDMHTMPKHEFVVGDPNSNLEENPETETNNTEHSHSHHHDMVEFKTEDRINANTETILTAVLNQEGEPLKGATVQFEVWKDTDEKHEYIDAVEVESGEYNATTIFAAKGTYNVTVHVRKDDLHEHKEETIHVE